MTLRPSTPRPKRPLAFKTPVSGPYYLHAVLSADTVSIQSEHLGELINEFVRYCIPPDPGDRGAFIQDADGTIVIGYAWSHVDNEVEWVGTSVGCDYLLGHASMPPLLSLDIERQLKTETLT